MLGAIFNLRQCLKVNRNKGITKGSSSGATSSSTLQRERVALPVVSLFRGLPFIFDPKKLCWKFWAMQREDGCQWICQTPWLRGEWYLSIGPMVFQDLGAKQLEAFELQSGRSQSSILWDANKHFRLLVGKCFHWISACLHSFLTKYQVMGCLGMDMRIILASCLRLGLLVFELHLDLSWMILNVSLFELKSILSDL